MRKQVKKNYANLVTMKSIARDNGVGGQDEWENGVRRAEGSLQRPKKNYDMIFEQPLTRN